MCASTIMPKVKEKEKGMEILKMILSEHLDHKMFDSTGKMVFEILQSKDSARDCWQFKSIVCGKGVKREDVEKVLGGSGSKVPSWQEF